MSLVSAVPAVPAVPTIKKSAVPAGCCLGSIFSWCYNLSFLGVITSYVS